MRKVVALIALAFVAQAFSASTANAQGVLGRLKKKAAERVEDKTDKATDKALDKVECLITDEKCIRDAKAAGKQVEVKGKAGGSGSAAAAASSTPEGGKPGQGAWANFDFVPGDKVVFAEDFTADRVGNFPKRLELEKGTMEVVEWPQGSGRRWLRATGASEFTVTLPQTLPERWTMEFEETIPWQAMWFYPGEKTDQGPTAVQTIFLSGTDVHAWVPGKSVSEIDPRKIFHDMNGENEFLSRPFHVRMQADGNYMKVYLDEQRIVNMPNMGRWQGKEIHFYFRDNTVNGRPSPPLITNISINAGGKELYDKLMADGRLAVQGIYFDVGSDHIRPESSGTLAEIVDMLKGHTDLKIGIEGHTDNVGDAAGNQSLSDKRAHAVKEYLEKNGVDGSRMQYKGYGATKPASPNTTPEGRQNNRRVELVKM